MNVPPVLPWLNAPGWLPLIHALMHTLWQGALAAGGLFLALRLIPTRCARLRYGLSAAALVMVLLAGVGSWALLDTPRARPAGAIRIGDASKTVVERFPEGGAPPAMTVPPFPATEHPAPQSTGTGPSVVGTGSAGAKTWVRWVTAGWLLGAFVGLLRTVKGTLGAGRLRRRCRDLADPRVLALAKELCTRLGLSRRVRFLVCDEIGVPSMLGIFYPAVLLPASLVTGVSTEQLRAIIAHELAHIRRLDYLANLAQMLVEALLFFNPFVWWLSRQMRLEREACCDEIAAGECQSPARYVEALVAVIERSRLAVAAAPILAATGPDPRGGNALERARRLLVPGYQPAFRVRWFTLAAVLVISGLALGGLWWGTRAVAQTIHAPETREKSAEPDLSANPTPPDPYVAPVSTVDGAPADDDSATAYIYESSGPNSRSTGAFAINQPGLIVNHQKGRFTIRPKADSRTLACAVTMQGYAAAVAGPFAPPFKELENLHFTLQKGLTGHIQTVDETGRPIVGASLDCYYPGPPRVELGEVRTDASGVAALEHVGSTPLNVRVLANGFQGEEIKNIQFDPAHPYRWTLKAARALPGVVTAVATGKPIAGATVKLAGVRGAVEETHGGPEKAPLLAGSDAQGRFALTSLRPDCRYYLFVEAPGYSGVYVRKLELSQGELQVSLGPERTVRGKLVHIPDSAFFMDSVPLFYGQPFTFDDGETFFGQRSLPLHPKNGEADFSIGPFFVTQRRSRPTDPAVTDEPVTMHLDKRREVHFAISDLPKVDYTEDLADEPSVSPAPAVQLNSAPAVSSTPESPDLVNPDGKQRDEPSQGRGYSLRNAAGEGRIEIVRGLLDHGADINFQDEHGFTSLSWAAYCGHEDVCLLLLERGADGRIEDQDGHNGTWHAAAGPVLCVEALTRMIKAGVPVNGKDKRGDTILEYMMNFSVNSEVGDRKFPTGVYTAADSERSDESERRVVELLIAEGVDPNGGGGDGPLIRAMHNCHYAAARVLLAHGADPARKDKDGNTALYAFVGYAVDRPLPLDLFKTLWQRSGSLNPEFTVPGVTPSGKISLLETVIVVAGSDPSRRASFHEVLKIMLDGGATFAGVANANAQALLQAAARGDLAAIQQSIGQGAPVNAADDGGWDALTLTTALGYIDCADWLIDHGADVNGRHRSPWNAPLPNAVSGGQADLVEKLLTKGATLDGVYNGLHTAALLKNTRIFEALLKAGADPKGKPMVTVSYGGKSFTPPGAVTLYLCIENGQTEMARTLLDRGADADPPNLQDGRNLAWWAVDYERPEILRSLLDHGADPRVKDDQGDSALDLARIHHPKLVPMLEEATKRRSAPAMLPPPASVP